MPMRRAVRITRQAISPRLAMRIFLNIAVVSVKRGRAARYVSGRLGWGLAATGRAKDRGRDARGEGDAVAQSPSPRGFGPSPPVWGRGCAPERPRGGAGEVARARQGSVILTCRLGRGKPVQRARKPVVRWVRPPVSAAGTRCDNRKL